MSEKVIREINNLISSSRYEDALSALRRQNHNERNCDSLIKEAYLLFTMEMLKQCGDFCFERLEKKKNFEFSLILKACENRYRRRSLLLAPISDYQPADTEFINGSISALMAVFCDIPEARNYIDGMISQNTDPVYKYLLAQIQRLSGQISEAMETLKSVPTSVLVTDLNEKLKKEKDIFLQRSGKTSAAKQELEDMAMLSAEELMVRGFWSISEKDSICAFKYFGEAVKADPSMAIAWYYVGVLQSVLGAKDRGEQCFNKFLELFPQSAGFYRNQLLNLQPGTARGQIEDYYHRWIGYMPADPASWMAYLRYLLVNKDPVSVGILAAEILDNYSKNWFISKESSAYFITVGILKMYANRFSAAEDSFRTALKYNNNKSLALIYLGKLAEISGVAVDAVDNYEKAAIDENTQFLPKYLIVNTLIKKKNFKKALNVIDEILRKYPRSPLACLKKAEIYFEQPDIKSLKKYLSELKNDQLSPEISVLTAMISLRDASTGDAVLELEKAYRLYPDNHIILKNLAILYLKSEQYGKCISLIETSHVKPVDIELMLMKGCAMVMKGDYAEAFEHLNDYLALEPFDSRAWHLLALSAFHLDKFKISAKAFEKSLFAAGGKIYNRLNLAIIYALNGRYKEAADLIELPSYSKYATDNNYFLLSSYLNYALGKYEKALEDIQKLLKTKKNSPEGYLLKSAIEYAEGKLSEADKTLQHASKECGLTSAIVYNRAYLHLIDKKYDEANKELSDLLASDPSFYEAWLAKAVINWLRQNEEEATTALKGAKKLKNPSFKSWLQKASTLKSPLDAISFYSKINLNFYLPEIFTMHYNDPLNTFLFEKLDKVFKNS